MFPVSFRVLRLPAVFVASLLLGALSACSDSVEQDSQRPAPAASPRQAIAEAQVPPLDPSDASLLASLEGETLSLGDYAGGYVLLNYWATWCAPCIEEIPSLFNAVSQLGPDYTLLLVSDEPAEKIQDFLADHDFDGNFIRLTRYFSQHGVNAVPSTILYGPQGQVLDHWLGAQHWDSPTVLREIRNAAGQ